MTHATATPFAPLVALVRRDLAGSRRGAAVLVARGLAIGASGFAAVLMVQESTYLRNQLGVPAAFGVLGALGVLATLLAPALAVGALRRERDAGTLDLLLLAGIRPGTLALGRIVSVFFIYATLLLAALPAIAFFWYFRSPTPKALGLAVLVLLQHYALVAALVVAISAWGRRSGPTLAFALLALALLHAGLVWASIEKLPIATPLVLGRCLDPSIGHGLYGIPVHVVHATASAAAVFVLWAVASVGVARRPPAAQRDRLLEAIERRPRKVDRFPLAWLVRRGSATARPVVQLPLVGAALALLVMPMVAAPELASLVGAMLAAAGHLAGLGVAATTITTHRERNAWPSILGTVLTGRQIVGQVALAAALGSVVPMAAGSALVAWSTVADGGTVLAAAGKLASLASAWLVAVTSAACASMIFGSAATAVAVGLAYVVGLPVAIFAGSICIELLSDWDRAALPAAGVLAFVIVVGTLAVRSGLRRMQGVFVLVGAFLLAAAAIPLVLWMRLDDVADNCGLDAFSGLSTMVVECIRPFEGSLGDLSYAKGVVKDLVVVVLLVALFRPRLDRWLGRAA